MHRRIQDAAAEVVRNRKLKPEAAQVKPKAAQLRPDAAKLGNGV
jgi:hypothetical protein